MKKGRYKIYYVDIIRKVLTVTTEQILWVIFLPVGTYVMENILKKSLRLVRLFSYVGSRNEVSSLKAIFLEGNRVNT